MRSNEAGAPARLKFGNFGWLSVAAALVGASAQTGCIQKADSNSSSVAADPSSPTYNPPVGVVDDVAGFYVRAVASPDYTTYTHLGLSSSYTYSGSFTYGSKCTVDVDNPDVTQKDVLCYIEAEELDLYFHGLSIQYNVPTTSCEYFEFMPPYYFVRPAGNGPQAARYGTDLAGAPDATNFNVVGATPTCLYDYTEAYGPNCCEGKYGFTQGAWDDTMGAIKYGPASSASWGGKYANCLGGPAMTTQSRSVDGFPLRDLYYIRGAGLNKVYDVDAPINRGLNSNVYVANYFISTLDYHTPNAQFPAAVRPSSNAVVPANVPQDPTGINHVPYLGNTNPYYSFTCFNRNHEAKARIRLMVRSWDITGFAGVGTSYVPTPGTEPSYGGAYHDFPIWEIFKAFPATYTQGYPGSAE